jgi:transposase
MVKELVKKLRGWADRVCLYWQLTQLEVECEGIAPSLIPNKASEQIKTDWRNAPAELRAVIEALQALHGVAQTTAATIVSELGSLSSFANPRQLMGYCGLVASEHSSGGKVQRGPITKTGNAHLRRVLVEAG